MMSKGEGTMFGKKKENSCYTYFSIRGDFDPDVVTSMLELNPYKSWKSTDKRSNGTQFGFACWDYGRCEEYDIETENQMMKTIANLIPKINILNQIKEKFDVEFYLEVVPKIYSKNASPCLGVNLDIIDFCHRTRTLIDVDLYVMG